MVGVGAPLTPVACKTLLLGAGGAAGPAERKKLDLIILEAGNVNISCLQALESSRWRVARQRAGLALGCEAVLVALQLLPERGNFLYSEQCSKFDLGQAALRLAQISSNYVPDFSGRGLKARVRGAEVSGA